MESIWLAGHQVDVRKPFPSVLYRVFGMDANTRIMGRAGNQRASGFGSGIDREDHFRLKQALINAVYRAENAHNHGQNQLGPVMHLKEIRIAQDRFPTTAAYPFNLPVIQHTTTVEFPTPVTVFTGENGTGKSTLLKAICRRCNVHIWEGMHRARYKASRYENMLHLSMDVEWADGPVPGSFFSPELFRNFSQLVDEWAAGSPDLLGYFGGDSLVTQSHGQSCMAYFKSIYRVKGLHFLDEPEAALSPATQLKLLDLLGAMSAAGHAQFIISTHSPILMSCPNASVFDFNGSSITRTVCEQTRHYQIYKEFFSHDV